ncbi:MAG: hypothetical protein JWM53_6630 [bacterium]|nr:hypothetical protein [bacterium]
MPLQGKATPAWATNRFVIEICRDAFGNQLLTAAVAAPAARAPGVRTP